MLFFGLLFYQDVFWFNISMENTLSMHMIQSKKKLKKKRAN